jgi:hypothetical protein
MGSSDAYDKADHHFDEVNGLKLPKHHAYHHTTFFFSWVIRSGLMSDWFEAESASQLKKYRADKLSINKLYEWWDCCLMPEMLNAEGNKFARAYFDFDRGRYLDDYHEVLQRDLPSEFHVPYTTANEAAMHRVISKRFGEWKSGGAKAVKRAKTGWR